MLPGRHRLRTSRDFHEALRSGHRVGSATMVVHLRGVPDAPPGSACRVGFIVSRKVGGAVMRNRVKRRVRHLARSILPRLPPGSSVVVRVNEPATRASTGTLTADLDSCLRRLTGGTE